MYTITLASGEKITNLEVNGTNFVNPTRIDERIFDNAPFSMTISDGKTERTYHNLKLIQQVQYEAGGGWYLAFAEMTKDELFEAEINAKLEYMAMMADVEMEV